MSQNELIEEYITNRLTGDAKAAFEQKMSADPNLKAEVGLQREIIEGVKQARIAELKTMLSNVPIGGATSALVGKAALATLSAGIIGTVLYFSLRPETPDQEIEPQQQVVTEEQMPATAEPNEPNSETITQVTPTDTRKEDANTKKSSSDVKKMTSPKPMMPKVEVLDLTEDTQTNDSGSAAEAPKPTAAPTVSASAIEVETDNTQKSYPFHYQFKEDKLVLFGPFDASLYEIIEINGSTQTLFLFYKKSYYSLDKSEHQVAPLIMIRDQELLDMLNKYRNKK